MSWIINKKPSATGAKKGEEKVTAREKTRIMLVMGIIHNLLDDIRQIIKDKEVLKQADEVEKWSYKCINSLNIKRFSAGANRDIDEASAKINALYHDLAELGIPDSLLQRMIGADALICDIRTKHSLASQCWRHLDMTAETMLNAFIEAFPDKQSVDFYFKAEEVVRI